jgi:hypothetical protein
MQAFVDKLTTLRGDQFDLSQVNYLNYHNKIIVTCNVCKSKGINYTFETTPMTLVNAKIQNCCAVCLDKIIDTQSFIIKARKIRGEQFDLSQVNYVNTSTKMLITCNICKNKGIDYTFEITPSALLNLRTQNSCNVCADRTVDTQTFIIKANKVRYDYDYSEVIYENRNTNVKIKCLKCNVILNITPANFLDTRTEEPCPNCTNKPKRVTISDYHNISEIKNGKYLSNKIPLYTARKCGPFLCEKNHIFLPHTILLNQMIIGAQYADIKNHKK